MSFADDSVGDVQSSVGGFPFLLYVQIFPLVHFVLSFEPGCLWHSHQHRTIDWSLGIVA